MGAFLALAWDGGDAQACAEAEAVAACVRASGSWLMRHAARDLQVWTQGPSPPTVEAAGPLVIVGTCLQRDRTEAYRAPNTAPDTSVDAIAAKLSEDAWGAYIALLGGRAIFRDPSGAVDCISWPIGRVRLITSDVGRPPPGLLPPRCGLDWDVIASWCQDSSSGTVRAGLAGMAVVGPGSLMTWPDGEAVQRLIWRPSHFVATTAPQGRDTLEGLRHVVDLATEGLLRSHDAVVQEISGGLDSAVVAAALVAAGLRPKVVDGLNYFGDRPEGDERAFATAIAGHLGLPLTCVAKPMTPFTAEDFRLAATGLRPGFATVDPPRDRDTADRLRTAGATGLVTGHGGDVVFFQMPTLAIAADQVHRRGHRGLTSRFLEDIARLTHRSAWSVLNAGLRADRTALGAYHPPTLGAGPAEAPWTDPWTADCRGAPPAKRLQVRALHRAQLAMGWSHRGQVADVIHPLLSQPVMEFCLGLTSEDLTRGGRDRVVAREAFRGRLPHVVIERRSKGDLTAHYGRVVAASLPFLRPLLLDGCLAAAGLLDRRRLDATLSADQLILARANSEILVAALIECWVRWWQTRVPDAPHAQRPT